MAELMELDGLQVLDGFLLPSHFSDLSPLNHADAVIYSPVNDHITVHSPTAENWHYYGMPESPVVKDLNGKLDIGIFGVPVEQQFHEFLPTALEDSQLSDLQVRQILPILQVDMGVHSVNSQCVETPAYAVQSPPEQVRNFVHLQVSSPWQVMPGVEFEGTALSDVSVIAGSDDNNVMDLLSQLCDTFDGDMIIDQTELTASYASLPQMSLEDVENLLSSDTLVSEMHASSSRSSSVTSLQDSPPDSPESESGFVSSSDQSSVAPLSEKKQRKKDQNKTAALRYRQKKRCEHGSVMTEYEDLEKRNTELKTKVSEMMKEINYLKGLIAEIYA